MIVFVSRIVTRLDVGMTRDGFPTRFKILFKTTMEMEIGHGTLGDGNGIRLVRVLADTFAMSGRGGS
jgi:hypothetical protein